MKKIVLFSLALLFLASCSKRSGSHAQFPTKGGSPFANATDTTHSKSSPFSSQFRFNTGSEKNVNVGESSSLSNALEETIKLSLDESLNLYCARLGIPKEYLASKILDRYNWGKLPTTAKSQITERIQAEYNSRLRKSGVLGTPTMHMGEKIPLNHSAFDALENNENKEELLKFIY
jgi:hypothetical protein